jgi:hypothetical protein
MNNSCLLGYNAALSVESQHVFRRNILFMTCACWLTMVNDMAYFSTMKKEEMYSSEISVVLQRSTPCYIPEYIILYNLHKRVLEIKILFPFSSVVGSSVLVTVTKFWENLFVCKRGSNEICRLMGRHLGLRRLCSPRRFTIPISCLEGSPGFHAHVNNRTVRAITLAHCISVQYITHEV